MHEGNMLNKEVDNELTLTSVWWIKTFKAGNNSKIVGLGGGGSLLLHKLTITHVTLRKNVIGISGRRKANNLGTTPILIT